MAGDNHPTHLPPAKLPIASNLTYIDCIDEDILREIFIRLPSLAALIRAACTCRAWRSAVVSSPAFRRRFRDLHRAPLLGLFFQVPAPAQTPNLPAFPAFIPARHRDRDLAAAVRCGDFFLTSLQERPDESFCWDIIDSRHGYILLMNWDEGLLTLFNPLMRWSKTFDLGPTDLFNGRKGDYEYEHHHARLVYSDENPMSLRVVMLANDKSRVRAAVLSSETWEWSLLPWVDVPARPTYQGSWIQNDCRMQANGLLYWVYVNQKILITLDTRTMEFSTAELRQCLQNRNCHFVLAEVLHAVPEELNVVAVMDGFAYLAIQMHDNPHSRWHLSLCLETKELEKLFRVAFDDGVHPYVMAWPSALVGNYGTFALGNAP
ncbi:hypothetical protein ACQ4PT_022054 [Festuca glaucescens]